VSAVSDRSVAPTEGGQSAAATTAGPTVNRPGKLVESVVAVALASAFLMAPLVGWIHVHRIVTTARLTPAAASELGAKKAGLDPTVFRRLRRIIPARTTYWIGTSQRIRSSTIRGVFPLWASGALLPRIAVAKPATADWVVVWGYSPRRLPVKVIGVQVLAVRTPPRLPVYVARVAR